LLCVLASYVYVPSQLIGFVQAIWLHCQSIKL